MYNAKFYADDTSRDCILKDDLVGAKESVKMQLEVDHWVVWLG